MHVLITADTVGGVWTYTRELACGLLARGHRVTLVSFGGMPTDAQSTWALHKNLTYYPTAFPLEWMQDADEGITESARYLAQIIDQSRPDVLHFNQYCYGALECGIPKVVVAHSDVASWWSAVHDCEPPDSPWLRWYTTLVSRGLACADAVVAPSKWMLSTLGNYYGAPAYGAVIYNGRSPSLFRSSEQKAACVVSVGRIWDKAKQISLLLARKQSVPVQIVGSTKHPEEALAGPVTLPKYTNLQYCGEQDEAHLCTIYSDAAAYAATSRYEPFGLAPVEAALSHCALIANDIPIFRELWDGAAVFFKRNDPDSLANAIAVLCEEKRLRDFYADMAYEFARSRFDSQRMVSEYEQLYASLTGGRYQA